MCICGATSAFHTLAYRIQWQTLIQWADLAEQYNAVLRTLLLELSSGSRFATEITFFIFFSDNYKVKLKKVFWGIYYWLLCVWTGPAVRWVELRIQSCRWWHSVASVAHAGVSGSVRLAPTLLILYGDHERQFGRVKHTTPWCSPLSNWQVYWSIEGNNIWYR